MPEPIYTPTEIADSIADEDQEPLLAIADGIADAKPRRNRRQNRHRTRSRSRRNRQRRWIWPREQAESPTRIADGSVSTWARETLNRPCPQPLPGWTPTTDSTWLLLGFLGRERNACHSYFLKFWFRERSKARARAAMILREEEARRSVPPPGSFLPLLLEDHFDTE